MFSVLLFLASLLPSALALTATERSSALAKLNYIRSAQANIDTSNMLKTEYSEGLECIITKWKNLKGISTTGYMEPLSDGTRFFDFVGKTSEECGLGQGFGARGMLGFQTSGTQATVSGALDSWKTGADTRPYLIQADVEQFACEGQPRWLICAFVHFGQPKQNGAACADCPAGFSVCDKNLGLCGRSPPTPAPPTVKVTAWPTREPTVVGQTSRPTAPTNDPFGPMPTRSTRDPTPPPSAAGPTPRPPKTPTPANVSQKKVLVATMKNYGEVFDIKIGGQITLEEMGPWGELTVHLAFRGVPPSSSGYVRVHDDRTCASSVSRPYYSSNLDSDPWGEAQKWTSNEAGEVSERKFTVNTGFDLTTLNGHSMMVYSPDGKTWLGCGLLGSLQGVGGEELLTNASVLAAASRLPALLALLLLLVY